MSKERRRTVRTAQVRMREMDLLIADTLTTPVAQGFDRFGVSSVTDDGPGVYTINIANAFGRDDIMGFVTACSAPGYGQITAVTRNTIQVSMFDTAGAAADIDFFIRILGSEFNYDI